MALSLKISFYNEWRLLALYTPCLHYAKLGDSYFCIISAGVVIRIMTKTICKYIILICSVIK